MNPEIHNCVADALKELEQAAASARSGKFAQQLTEAVQAIVDALSAGKKVLTCGNGGSAADASHLAEELLGRYKATRRPWPAISLCADAQALTCIANDFGFENVFARQIEALGTAGDVLVAFTTSGKSQNVNRALQVAQDKGMKTIAVSGGATGGESAKLAELVVLVPSENSARVQELHTFVVHAVCEAVEQLA